MATSGHSNSYLDQILAARKAARKRLGLSAEEGGASSSASLPSAPSFSGTSLKIPKGLVGTTGNQDLDDALNDKQGALDFANAAGVGDEAAAKAAGDPGFLSTALGYLVRPRAAVVGGLAAALGSENNTEDESDDSVLGAVAAALTGRNVYGAGDYGVLRYDKDDNFGQRAGKAVGAFAGDVVLDPLTYVGGVGLVGRGAKEVAGAGVKAVDGGLVDEALAAVRAGNKAPATGSAIGQSTAAKAAGASDNLAGKAPAQEASSLDGLADQAQDALRNNPLFDGVTPATGAQGALDFGARNYEQLRLPEAPAPTGNPLFAGETRFQAPIQDRPLPFGAAPEQLSLPDQLPGWRGEPILPESGQFIQSPIPGLAPRQLGLPLGKGQRTGSAAALRSREVGNTQPVQLNLNLPTNGLDDVVADAVPRYASDDAFDAFSGFGTDALRQNRLPFPERPTSQPRIDFTDPSDGLFLRGQGTEQAAAAGRQGDLFIDAPNVAQRTLFNDAGELTTETSGIIRNSTEQALNDVDPELLAREGLTDRLAAAAEEGFYKRRGRGVRQALVQTLKSEGVADDLAEDIGTRMFNSLDQGIRGGVGIQGPIGRGIAFTPGGGQLTDALGLGRVADKAWDLRNALRFGNIGENGAVRGGLAQATQGLTSRFGGRDGEDLARYLRGDITYDDFRNLRSARNKRRNSLADLGTSGATRLAAANQVVQSLGRDKSEQVRQAVKDAWAGDDLSSLAPEVRAAATQARDLLNDGIRNLGDQFRTLAEETGFFTPEQAAEFLANQAYQPRVLTRQAKETFERNQKNATGIQREGSYSATKKRSGVYMKEDETQVGVLDDDGNPILTAMTNREANASARERGIDTEFVEDPFEAFDSYANSLGYSVARLRQVKELQDAGLVVRDDDATRAFTRTLPDGTEQEYVSLGGATIKGRNLSNVTKNLWVPSYAREAVSNLLSATPQSTNAFVNNVYKPFYSFFKTTATVGRGPGYHIRNMVGAGWQNFVNGVAPSAHTAQATIMQADLAARYRLHDFLAGKTGRLSGQKKKEFGDLSPELQALVVAKAGSDSPEDLARLTILDLDDLVDQSVQAALKGKTLRAPGGREPIDLYQAWKGQQAQGLGRDTTVLQDTSADQLGTGNLTRGLDTPTLFTGTAAGDRNGLQRGLDYLVNNPYISTNVNVAQGTETYFRGAAFLEGARRFGLDQDGLAADLFAKSLHLDYDNLSEFERRVVKNIIPFYTFMRGNVPIQFQQIMMQPARFGQLSSLQYELENQFGEKNSDGTPSNRNNDLPEWVRERMGFLLNSDPTNPLALMVESPATDLNKLINGDPLNFGGPIDFNELLNSTNPLFKTPIEALAKKDLQTNASLDRQVAAPWYLGGALSPLSRSTNDEGQATVDARIPSAIADLLPPVGVIDRLSSGAIEDALGEQESKQSTRALSNRLGLLAGTPLATFDQRQQEAEARNRSRVIDRFTKQYLSNNQVDGAEQELLRELGRTPGYEQEYIAAQLRAMMGTPITPSN